MKNRLQFALWMIGGLALLAVAVGVWALPANPAGKAEVAKGTPPATVGKIAKEAELNHITLRSEAEARLGIETALVEKKSVARMQTFGGEIVIPPGRAVTVAAPFAGTLRALQASSGDSLNVKKGQTVYTLVALLTPEAQTALANSRVEAEGQVNNATVQLEAARIVLKRAKQLLSDKAGSLRAVDEAQAQYDLAEKVLEAARAKKTLFEGEVSKLTSISVKSPEDGFIRNRFAVDGQTVPSGAPLFEVVNPNRVWVRIPVYGGELKDIATERPAEVSSLGPRSSVKGRAGKPVTSPPAANATAATVDLHYEIDNSDGRFRPGERVAVTVSLRGAETNLVVPQSALIHDYLGGTWVYESIGQHTFIRRRVRLSAVVAAQAVLSEGPKPGAKVVTHGAAELFGTEFGFGK